MAAAAARYPTSFLVFAICTVTTCLAEDVFVSINCGASAAYTDENLINWSGDGRYVDNGEEKTVESSSSISRVMDTLRVFTTRRKNCYYIDSVKQGRVLVRASFHYGNYDGKSSPPSFDLMLDGNYWATVNTSTNSGNYVFYEVIYVMKTGSISVCVARTVEGQFPFVSALEVRRMESSMYRHVDDAHPLFRITRFAYGADKTIRYPNDPYDRVWSPFPASGTGLTTLSSNVSVNSFSVIDNPPPIVLQTAISAVNVTSAMPLSLPLPAVDILVYINFYFSEVVPLGPKETRSFRIFKDGKSFSDPIQPINPNITEQYVSYLLYSSNISFSLVPEPNATLPPLINALEIFMIGRNLTDGTDNRDVSGLTLLQSAFNVLQGWRGDPCLPAPYSWDWIECSNDSTPRVTSLLLGSYGLSGMLPNISSMDALETIDVHNNSINGPIPDSLANLSNLKELNLANNNFNGSIPTSLSQKNGLNIVVTGNPNLCNSGESCPTSDSNTSTKKSSGANMKNKTRATLFGITIPSLFIIFIGMFIGL